MGVSIQKRVLLDFAVITFITILFVFSLDYTDANAFCLFTFFLNGIVILFFMANALNKASFSIELVYWLFMYFFMFFAPLIQYTYEYYPWYYQRFADDVLITANVSILVWNLIIAFITNSGGRYHISEEKNVYKDDDVDFQVSDIVCKVLTVLVLLIAVRYFLVNGTAIFNASRDTGADLFASDESSIGALLNKGMAAILTFSATLSFYYGKQTKEWMYFIISMFAVIICLFPTSIARYMMAVVYGSILITAMKSMKKGSLFFWGFTLAFLIIFPAMDVFRYLGLDRVDILGTIISVIKNFFEGYLEAHYDAYSMFCSVIRYKDFYGLTIGRQMLGCLLFFVPRKIWPTKPIGSGALVAYTMRYSFINVSCPLIAEFVINFGYIGVLMGSIILGIIIKKSDDAYASEHKSMFTHCFYPAGAMFLFFILRGDFLSSFSYFVAFFAVYFAGVKANEFVIERFRKN